MLDTPRPLTEAECQYVADVSLRGWGERDPMGPPVVRITVSDLEALVRERGDAIARAEKAEAERDEARYEAGEWRDDSHYTYCRWRGHDPDRRPKPTLPWES